MPINLFKYTSLFKRAAARSQGKSQPLPPEVFRHPLYFIGFGFGSGAIPIAPGTFGTLFAIPFYLSLKTLSIFNSFWGYVLFLIIFIALSSWLSDYLSRKMGSHDHPGMCIDEFAGFFVTMLHAPPGWLAIVVGFLLFRFFDIIKPWPISYLDEHIGGGFGMVLDDVVAGLFSAAILQIGWLLC